MLAYISEGLLQVSTFPIQIPKSLWLAFFKNCPNKIKTTHLSCSFPKEPCLDSPFRSHCLPFHWWWEGPVLPNVIKQLGCAFHVKLKKSWGVYHLYFKPQSMQRLRRQNVSSLNFQHYSIKKSLVRIIFFLPGYWKSLIF